ncbi:putative selection and upkeep of intraepithelial T-cells protein 1 homolog [Desmodus rotundus]|uniref:putative selection and upkeep of intraepithelial T-cells protein 1 homolog n=1 Tax=Desmodus rotundus TaxID=9430 RepID=UPI0023812CAA|nr:putative selection and upkeep of intraepithelial T-cells protein 1 homolog [Desmodus rotundus]XP_045060209.2 putative selection and upkeep of intraepithelial T-cells protein 1 homolog [Desmodus rotundus]XP_053775480.1 putative selection and upkeep of intraepithelial T-cells protein 1 homolog [Desmodus rotundus]XP_053775481.1 putative selection and upkeep of intraepithelial T-cells protein 1 homolog [Desmodus rotundus]
MESTGPPLPRHFIILLLLQMITPSSAQFTVTGLQGLIVAPLGGVVELSCQLSPPKSAEHMEIRWFRDRYTQPVHLYRNGRDLYRETISRYVERTELLKGAIREGKVTLRIFNVSVDDHGQYHCYFRDGDFYDEAIEEVKVTATSLEVQIHVHPPNIKGLLVECNSRGWFPQPQMEWRDSRGGVIPATSESHSQDVDKLFHMKMTLFLTQSSSKNITCYLRNPVTGQEERTSIALSDQLFPWNSVWIMILSMILALLLIFVTVPCVDLHYRLQNQQKEARRSSPSSVCSRVCTGGCLPATPCTDCCSKRRSPFAVGTGIILSSICVISILICHLRFKSRVPAADPHFQLDTIWLEDITVILCVLTVFITMIISFIYFRFRGFLQS